MTLIPVVEPFSKATVSRDEVEQERQGRLQITGAVSSIITEDDDNWILTTTFSVADQSVSIAAAHDSAFRAHASAASAHMSAATAHTSAANMHASAAKEITLQAGPYIAPDPQSWVGRVVGTGQCVAYVQIAAAAPLTFKWRQGASVKGDTSVKGGTAIATFDMDGKYGNHTDGSSHAAIYLSQDGHGLTVIDQWVGQPVHERLIRFGGAIPVNDGDKFRVIL